MNGLVICLKTNNPLTNISFQKEIQVVFAASVIVNVCIYNPDGHAESAVERICNKSLPGVHFCSAEFVGYT